MGEKKNFYDEQIEKIQEEFRNVPEKETRRRLDLMQILGGLESQISKIRKEEYMNTKEKLYIDWEKQQGGYEISTYSHLGLLRFECVGLDQIYARLNTFRLSDYDIYLDCQGYGLGIKDILNQKGLEVNRLIFKKIK